MKSRSTSSMAVAILVGTFGFATTVTAQPGPGPTDQFSVTGSTVGSAALAGTLSTALSRAHVDAVQAAITPSAFKGAFGEAHMDRYLTGYLRSSQAWQPIRSRIGPQGIDGIYLRYDRGGNIRSMIVSEAKYGSSQLGVTRDGLQLGANWSNRRLSSMAQTYGRISKSIATGTIKVQTPTSGMKHRLQVPLADGKAAVFWRNSESDPWKFAGPRKLLDAAGKQTSRVSSYFDASSRGVVSYRRYLYHTKVTSTGLEVSVRDAKLLDQLHDARRLPVVRRLLIPLDGAEQRAIQRMTRNELKSLIRARFPSLPSRDVQQYAEDISRSQDRMQSLFAGQQPSALQTVAVNSLSAGALSGGLASSLHLMHDLVTDTEIDLAKLGTTAGIAAVSGTVGSAVGQGTMIAFVNSPTLQRFATQASQSLRVPSATMFARGVSSLAGGGAATLVAAYGGYAMGQYDLETANRAAAAGLAGVGAGAAFSTGALSLAMIYGTASTGTAISTLSGAAANSAAMAWLGGGSVAAGGGGAAAGSAVLTGGTIIVVAAVTAAAMKGFSLYDEKQDNIRVKLTINELKTRYRRRVLAPAATNLSSQPVLP